ncbi:aldo/keto reductase, partial [Dactylosporangium sp. NPDC000555]
EHAGRGPGVPLIAAALLFAAAHPAAASVLIGAKSAAEIEHNLAVAAHPIPAAFWADLRDEDLVGADRPLPAA